MLFLLIMLIIFLLQDNATLHHLESLKEYIAFQNLNYFLEHKKHIFFYFFTYKRLSAIVTLIFSNFFQSSFSGRTFIPSHYFIDKAFNICYSFKRFSYFFMIYRCCYSILKAFINYLLIWFIVVFLLIIQSG